MGEVVVGNFITKLDIPPDRVIEGAIDAKLKSIVVIGYDEKGEEYFAASVADGGSVLWMMRRAEKALLEIGE